MHRLYLIPAISGCPESVIISDSAPAEVQREWGQADEIIDLEDDATHFPCDRQLAQIIA